MGRNSPEHKSHMNSVRLDNIEDDIVTDNLNTVCYAMNQ